MKLKQEPLTAEDVRLVDSQINAALVIVTGLRTYLEPAGKLQSAEIRQFKAAEIALQTIRVKTTTSRASEMTKRMSQARPGKL